MTAETARSQMHWSSKIESQPFSPTFYSAGVILVEVKGMRPVCILKVKNIKKQKY